MANAKFVRRGLTAAIVTGAVIGSCYYFLAKTPPPEIPSCPTCTAKVNSNTVDLTGDFGTVDSRWIHTQMTFTPTDKKDTTVPASSAHYTKTLNRTPFLKVTEAKMHFYYMVGSTEVEGNRTVDFILQQ